MHPIPETHEADDHYGPFLYGEHDLLEHLVTLGDRVREVVPACIGLSLSSREHEATFTVVASAAEIALLDAVQYLDGGPCVDAIASGQVLTTDDMDTLDPEWTLFNAATTANAIVTTLSLPVRSQGGVVAGFNLYSEQAHAFDGHHEALAEILGAWVDGAVSDRDLDFATREQARRAPLVLREATHLSVAAALLGRALDLEPAEAEERLRHAALRAAVTLPALVDSVIAMLSPERTS